MPIDIVKKVIVPGTNNFLTFAESASAPEQIMEDDEYKNSVRRRTGYVKGEPADNAMMNTVLRNLSVCMKGLTEVIAENGVDVSQDVKSTEIKEGLILSITNMIDDQVLQVVTPVLEKMQKQIDEYAAAYHGVPVGGILPISCSHDELAQFLLDYPHYKVCNGQNGTVDLQDRFVFSSSATVPAHSVGGSKTPVNLSIGGHSITEDELPSHKHEVPGTDESFFIDKWPFGAPSSAKTYIGSGKEEGYRVFSSPKGKNRPHDHTIVDKTDTDPDKASGLMPPYYSLIFVQKTKPY